jgi:nitric oxide reductase
LHSQLNYDIHIFLSGTLFHKLPNLKVAVPMEEVKYTNPAKDVGITELPVTW